MLRNMSISIFIFLFGINVSQKCKAQIYLDTSATIEARVNDLLSKMTLDEKIGQMIQMHYPELPSFSDITTYNLGSLLSSADSGPTGRTAQAWADLYDTLQSYALQTRLKIPLLFALDAVHGFGAMYGATVFPHNIGLGCTRNPTLVEQAAQIAATEISATGIDWTLGPVVAVARDERWGRTYESFGEDPNLVQEMSAATVRGFQGDTSAKGVNILACAKHYIGDGGTTNGTTNGNTQLNESALRAIHLPGYISSIGQKVGSIMVAQNQWNSYHCHGSRYLLTTLLKEELGFSGIVISDWNSFLYAGDPAVAFPSTVLYGSAIKNSINAGVDMAMMSNYSNYSHRTYIDTLKTLINNGAITIERVDDAVKRILTQKFRMGLFEHPFADRSLIDQIGSEQHRQVARECVRQSVVVLKKKDGILPISKSIGRIHLAGRHADNMGFQCGGWTITWQGSSGDITPGTTIREAIEQAVPGTTITYSSDGNGAEGADIGIAVIGELPYAEGAGDSKIYLDRGDIEAVQSLKNYNIPVVVILISGRPMIVNPILHQCDALIAAWLPGTEASGITDILFGDYPPVGLLSHSWPSNVSQIPINLGDTTYDPLFPYGYGITSLQDSPLGSPPEVFSASVTSTESMEISFNKKMKSPSGTPLGFSVLSNGNIPLEYSSFVFQDSDSTTFIFKFTDTLKKTNTYSISYAPGDIQSLDNGHLAAFENFPVYNILTDYQYLHSVPKKIEVEEFNRKLGISTVNCSDTGGGKAISFPRTGNWVEYYINALRAGRYLLEYRFASITDTGRIELIANGVSASLLNLPSTGSSSVWQSVYTIVHLSEGLQTIKILASRGRFSLNWMQLSISTGVETGEVTIQKFLLSQNYPNPFNPTTTINYQVPIPCNITLNVYDILGREVAQPIHQYHSAGNYQIIFNGSHLASGMYIYRLTAIDDLKNIFSSSKQMILIK